MTQEPGSHIVSGQEYGAYVGGEEEVNLTHELIQKALQETGKEVPITADSWWSEAHLDALRHFQFSFGDDNPLYMDPAYAKNTRWGGPIASPCFFSYTGKAAEKEWTQEELVRRRDPMSGIHAWQAGQTVYHYRPIRLGDTITSRGWRGDYVEKRSEFSGISCLDYNDREYRNQNGELVVRTNGYSIRGGRQRQWGERKKYADLQPETYSPEDMARIDADYARETVRGADPRYWEDVQVGEELVPVVKGPLTISDMIVWKMGGMSAMVGASGTGRRAYKYRKRHPRGVLTNEFGAPDILEAVHWDHGFSQRTGNPLAYDFGAQRVAWLNQVVTDWIGDDGWLKMFYEETRRFVYLTDTVWAKGRVKSKEIRNGEAIVELEIWVEDQRGRVTMPGRAEVLLPSRQLGPVVLPPKFEGPPGNWKGPAVD